MIWSVNIFLIKISKSKKMMFTLCRLLPSPALAFLASAGAAAFSTGAAWAGEVRKEKEVSEDKRGEQG